MCVILNANLTLTAAAILLSKIELFEEVQERLYFQRECGGNGQNRLAAAAVSPAMAPGSPPVRNPPHRRAGSRAAADTRAFYQETRVNVTEVRQPAALDSWNSWGRTPCAQPAACPLALQQVNAGIHCSMLTRCTEWRASRWR